MPHPVTYMPPAPVAYAALRACGTLLATLPPATPAPVVLARLRVATRATLHRKGWHGATPTRTAQAIALLALHRWAATRNTLHPVAKGA